MAWPEAFLVDVYETIVTCDFDVLRNELPVIAGAEPPAWNDAFTRLVPDLACGRITMAQGFGQTLAACGIRPAPALLSELVRKDRELLAASSCLYDDAIEFFQILQARGVQVASCAAAAAEGMTALQITRSGAPLRAPAPGAGVITSLLEATLMM